MLLFDHDEKNLQSLINTEEATAQNTGRISTGNVGSAGARTVQEID